MINGEFLSLLETSILDHPQLAVQGPWHLHAKGFTAGVWKNEAHQFLKISWILQANETSVLADWRSVLIGPHITPECLWCDTFYIEGHPVQGLLMPSLGNSLPLIDKESLDWFLRNASPILACFDEACLPHYIQGNTFNSLIDWKENIKHGLYSNEWCLFQSEAKRYGWDDVGQVVWNGDTHPGQFVMTEAGNFGMLDWSEAQWAPRWMPYMALIKWAERWNWKVRYFKNWPEVSPHAGRAYHWVRLAWLRRWEQEWGRGIIKKWGVIEDLESIIEKRVEKEELALGLRMAP